MASTASASGKLVMIGSYAVIDRPCVSLVMGFDQRVRATAQRKENGSIRLTAKQFGVDIIGSMREGALDFDFRGIDAAALESAKFMRRAAEIACLVLDSRKIPVTGFQLDTVGDPAFGGATGKSGLGSSAAVTAAVIAAVFEEHGLKTRGNIDLVHKAAQVSHAVVSGKVGSGIDVAASCFGCCEYVRYSPQIISGATVSEPGLIVSAINSEWDYSAKPVKIPDGLYFASANFVGTSASTGAMVKKVNEWKAAEPREYQLLISNLDAVDRSAIAAFSEGDLETFKKNFTQGRLLTKKLGEFCGAPVEPDDFTQLIEGSEENGAFCCKLPGAGGGDSIAAFCRSREEKARLETFWRNYSDKQLDVLDLEASNDGVRIEPG